MQIDLAKDELINLIKSTSLDYSQTTPELNEYGSWLFDMNGPNSFSWIRQSLLICLKKNCTNSIVSFVVVILHCQHAE